MPAGERIIPPAQMLEENARSLCAKTLGQEAGDDTIMLTRRTL